MMELTSNSTAIMTNGPSSSMWIGVVFAIEGSAVMSLNVPIWASVFKHAALRVEKQYVIVAGLSLADSCNGLAYFCCGVFRIYLSVSKRTNDLVSSWWCALVPYNLLWYWTETAATLMLAMVSVDRLISVAMPLKYLRLPPSYAWGMVGTAFCYSFVSGVTGFVAAYVQPVWMVNVICYLILATGPQWFSYYGAINTTSGFSSIIVYVIIGLLMITSYKRKIQQLMASNEPTRAMKRQAQLQKKMTESLAICCFFTLIFYCIPYIAVTLVMIHYPNEGTVAMLLWIVMQVNPMLNAVIYMAKHREMRMAVHALFTGKQMAPSLHTWLQAAAQSSSRSQTGTAKRMTMNSVGVSKSVPPTQPA